MFEETSRLIIGSTGSGKSEGELVDLVRLADQRNCAVVLLDGHGPLALRAAGHWAARGHESRMIVEELSETSRVLCWNMLPKSSAATPSQRRIEDAETRDEVAQCFMAQRNLGTLNDRAWTKEWLEAAIELCLAQPASEPLTSLLDAFRVGSDAYERLLSGCTRREVAEKFSQMERIKHRSKLEYERETGPARRLIESICTSEVVRLRSRPGPFDWTAALREGRLLIFDGGGIRSREIKRTLFSLVSLQVMQAVRRHFSATQEPLPVVLVLEEAGALDLVTPFILDALRELRKAGFAAHIITQSSLDFGDRDLFEALLSHAPWQAFYQLFSPADQELAAKALTNASFDARSIHFTRTRMLHDGAERVETRSEGESVGQGAHANVRRDRRTGTAFRARVKHVVEESYKTPQLFEQEMRTALATLRVGERFVRDRKGVRRERVRQIRFPWRRRLTDDAVRLLIERLRSRSPHQPAVQDAPAPADGEPPDAAARLQERAAADRADGVR